MRTTVRLDEALLIRAKEEAAVRRTTVTALIEEGLRLVLRRPLRAEEPRRVILPVSPVGGGTAPGVDIGNSAALLDLLDEAE